MKKERYIVLCILVVLFILVIIVLFEKYVISANLQEGATNNFSSYFVPIEEVKKELESVPDQNVLASTVFLTKNPSEKPNTNIFPDYTYYLVINPADVPDMESTLNYLTLTDLPEIKFVYSDYLSDGSGYYQVKKGYDAKNNNSWETTTQEFAIPFVLNGSSDSSWRKEMVYTSDAYGLQLKFGGMDYAYVIHSPVDGVSFGIWTGKRILQSKDDKIIQNPFFDEYGMTHYTNVAQDDILKDNLSSTDSGSTGLFVGYIDKLSYISKIDVQQVGINDVKPTILNKKIPVYLVKGDFNPYKPKPVSYFDTSSYCDRGKIYIGAKEYTTINKPTQENEESCAEKCEDDENCDMYLMSTPTTCWTYKDVSGISMFCNQGLKPKPRHEFWGKVKSNVKDNIVRYPESTAELEAQKEAKEKALAEQEAKEEQEEQEAKEEQEEQALAKEESEEEAKLTSEEERPDYSPAPSGSGGFGPIPSNAPKEPIPYCKSPTLPNVNNIHVHYSNTNANI